jgi:hypothetical protein
MDDVLENETSERILDVAEALFMAHGYSAVKLRDIAETVGMRHASLYYHVPHLGRELAGRAPSLWSRLSRYAALCLVGAVIFFTEKILPTC